MLKENDLKFIIQIVAVSISEKSLLGKVLGVKKSMSLEIQGAYKIIIRGERVSLGR